MKKGLLMLICTSQILFALQEDNISQRQYNFDKTWKIKETREFLKENTKKLESYYDQVDKQSKKRDFVRFNNKKVISHSEFSKLSLGEMHKYRTYVILSQFYIQWISDHNQLGGISVGGTLVNDSNTKTRYFKFASRYYSALHEIGVGGKIFAYCAAPYLTSCILIGIGEKW